MTPGIRVHYMPWMTRTAHLSTTQLLEPPAVNIFAMMPDGPVALPYFILPSALQIRIHRHNHCIRSSQQCSGLCGPSVWVYRKKQYHTVANSSCLRLCQTDGMLCHAFGIIVDSCCLFCLSCLSSSIFSQIYSQVLIGTFTLVYGLMGFKVSTDLLGLIPEMIRSWSAQIRSCDPDRLIAFHKRRSRMAHQSKKIWNQTVYCQFLPMPLAVTGRLSTSGGENAGRSPSELGTVF